MWGFPGTLGKPLGRSLAEAPPDSRDMGLTLALLGGELEARPVLGAKPSSQPRREGQPGGRGEGAEEACA